MEIVVFDTLVFGAGSSPTIWGRYAAWLGRSATAITPRAGVQIYVDDPAFVLSGTLEKASWDLTVLLLWFAIVGFPIKLPKAEGGKTIGWVASDFRARRPGESSPQSGQSLKREVRVPHAANGQLVLHRLALAGRRSL